MGHFFPPTDGELKSRGLPQGRVELLLETWALGSLSRELLLRPQPSMLSEALLAQDKEGQDLEREEMRVLGHVRRAGRCLGEGKRQREESVGGNTSNCIYKGCACHSQWYLHPHVRVARMKK